MFKLAAVLLGGCLLVSAPVWAAQTIDLSDPRALEALRSSNPEHYEKVRRILLGLIERPSRAEGNWLAVTFGATDVELGKLVFLTSDPPKQRLRFKLDQTQYRLELLRTDVHVEARPLDQALIK
jgi:hypothetical protein